MTSDPSMLPGLPGGGYPGGEGGGYPGGGYPGGTWGGAEGGGYAQQALPAPAVAPAPASSETDMAKTGLLAVAAFFLAKKFLG